ncbi:hypothetical protein A9Z42_0072890 [Trichoderma parareesei]|uniref:gamma-glutamylcyclotransferase n=1 Tax=Trichoderma parareesei TaxID=858221 RepID=A0A2H2ZX48_TRIPA|nr:hypothetical protein A9Z42_0072890 [Trichoderma parareesei]
MDSQSSHSSQDSQDSTLTITDENRSEILYFAYGSNLSTEQMRQRCPYSTAVGLGKLSGWKWIINERGYANIVKLDDGEDDVSGEDEGKGRMEDEEEEEKKKEKQSHVYGMLYLLPTEDEDRLDGYEGVPWAYEKVYLEASWVSSSSGGGGKEDEEEEEAGGEELTPVKVLAYVDRKRTTEGQPKREYVGRMERGLEDAVGNWGMKGGYADLLRRFWVDGR